MGTSPTCGFATEHGSKNKLDLATCVGHALRFGSSLLSLVPFHTPEANTMMDCDSFLFLNASTPSMNVQKDHLRKMSTAHQNVDEKTREVLVERAKKEFGMSDEEVNRMKTLELWSRLAEHAKQAPPPPPLAKALDLGARKELEEDTRTLIDMSHFTASPNMAEQKFARFQQLSKMREKLVKALAKNSASLKNYEHQLEAEDVIMLKRDLVTSQDKVDAVNQELVEIRGWFLDMKQFKEHFYHEFVKHSWEDHNGQVTPYFQQKLNAINQCLQHLSL